MENALGIAEKGESAGAAVGFGRGGEFVPGGSAEIVGADNDVAEGIAVVVAGSEIGADQAGGIRADTTLFRGSKLRQRLGKTQIGAAVGLDGFRQRLEGSKSGLLVGLGGGLIPFGFQGRKIEEEQADGENLPLTAFADHAHEDVMGIGGVWVRGFAKVNGEEGEIIAKVGTANLEFGGAVGSFTADDRTAGGIDGERGLAGVSEKDEALHQFGAGSFGEAGEGVLVAGSEKFCKGGLVVGAGGGEGAAKCRSRAGDRGLGR